MAKDAGKKSFLDFFKVKNIDDDEDEFDDICLTTMIMMTMTTMITKM